MGICLSVASTSSASDFKCWEEAGAAIEFRRVFQPRVISMEYRLAKVENPARQHGVTLATVATREVLCRETCTTSASSRMIRAYDRYELEME
jgi:hypothetical protein